MKISETDLILNPDGSVYHLNLLPKNISDTIIAVGDPSRVYMVSQFFDEVEFEMNKREFITHTGRFNGKKITVISTGIGTDNVEIFFTELDALVNIDLKTREPKSKRKKLKVIRIGTSGSLQEDIAVGSFIASDYGVGLDNLMNFYDLPMNDEEAGVAHDLQKKIGLPFMPYVVRGSESLRQQIAFDMAVGNTVTTPGFMLRKEGRCAWQTDSRIYWKTLTIITKENFGSPTLKWKQPATMPWPGYWATKHLA